MNSSRQHYLKRVFKIVAGCMFAWIILHITYIVVDGLNDESVEVDVAVVLGNKVELNGQPSKRLQARLDKALELYELGYFPFIIVSGGVGKQGFDEAIVMRDYLVQGGIPSEHVIVDSDGYNSIRTAENAKAISAEMNFDSALVISQYYHITRTKLAFRTVGFEEVYGAHAEFFELRDIYSILREIPAYYKYLFY